MYLNLHGNFPGLRSHYVLLVAVAIGVAVPVLAMSLRAATPQVQSTLARSGDVGFGKLPLSFEPNMGQTSDQVRYLVHAKGGTFFFTPSEVVLALMTSEKEAYKTITGSETDVAPEVTNKHIVRLRFDGANPSPDIKANETLPGRVNYLTGNEPSMWRTNLPTYAGVTYRKLYPGISLSYAGTEGLLKGTYTIAPGTDPAAIRWRYAGATSTRISSEGDLIISGEDSGMLLTERAPIAWQEIDGRQVPVQARYSAIQGGSVGFALGNYDKAYPLTIDPTLTYSTYLGGSGQDEGYGIDLDGVGNMYIVGLTQSTNFPTANAYQSTYQGGTDAFVTKMNPEGTALIYSTYLGGSGLDQGFAIDVDSEGNAIISGNTNSTNFPVQGAFQPNYGGGPVDSFATKLNPAGSGLFFSTYLGGSGFDTGQGVAVDGFNNIFVVGLSNSPDFPIHNPYQPNNAGAQDVTLTSFSDFGGGRWSTYHGGAGDDFGRGIAVDNQGGVYVTGSTISNNFPVVNA
ncbi:MAG: SBBP repeat-containing protein, partial [Chloroflexia bacterium]